MKSENSGTQEIEFPHSLASIEDAFLCQSVSKQRQSKIRLFVVETFMHYGTRFQLSLYWLFLFNRLKKQILEHFSMLY